jgi:potassium channel subfamily K
MLLLLKIDRKEWFAVTAFPLFAGTFGTIASSLNVCALVEPWRCKAVNDVVDYVGDPAWCLFCVAHTKYYLTK